MAHTGAVERKLRVFISYSRKDSAEFADELLAGLEVAGFAPFLDRHDIAPGEPWESRLGGLIEQSDTVVFVISPEAVNSDRCVWEVDKTLALSKRLLPVIHISCCSAARRRHGRVWRARSRAGKLPTIGFWARPLTETRWHQ